MVRTVRCWWVCSGEGGEQHGNILKHKPDDSHPLAFILSNPSVQLLAHTRKVLFHPRPEKAQPSLLGELHTAQIAVPGTCSLRWLAIVRASVDPPLGTIMLAVLLRVPPNKPTVCRR